MTKVIIAFHRDPDRVGQTVTLPDDDAAALVREGRARLAVARR